MNTLHLPVRSSLQGLALAAAMLTSGCAYVQGFYGSKAKTPLAVQPAPVALHQTQSHYAGTISAARAYVSTQLPVSQRMALIDVRDATEYRMGHAEAARHLPYPRMYQGCQPHPFAAPQAAIRSDDGGECRYGAVPGSEVRVRAADFWQAAQAALPYKDMPVAVLCRTAACAAEAADVLARPDLLVDASLKGQGYTEVYVVREGFVGEPMVAVDPGSRKVLIAHSKLERMPSAAPSGHWYGGDPVAWDADADGKLGAADLGGWRNFLGLPYTVSMSPNLIHEAAKPYYEQP